MKGLSSFSVGLLRGCPRDRAHVWARPLGHGGCVALGRITMESCAPYPPRVGERDESQWRDSPLRPDGCDPRLRPAPLLPCSKRETEKSPLIGHVSRGLVSSLARYAGRCDASEARGHADRAYAQRPCLRDTAPAPYSTRSRSWCPECDGVPNRRRRSGDRRREWRRRSHPQRSRQSRLGQHGYPVGRGGAVLRLSVHTAPPPTVLGPPVR